jgi:hypothetical protein
VRSDISRRGVKLPRVSAALGRFDLPRGADLPQVGRPSRGTCLQFSAGQRTRRRALGMRFHPGIDAFATDFQRGSLARRYWVRATAALRVLGPGGYRIGPNERSDPK